MKPISGHVGRNRIAWEWSISIMGIDKESSGMPSVDFHRRTTKVNLWMIVGIGVFFAICAAVVFWLSRQS
ncbi:MAG: hypothetical protein Q7S40_24175 [Opitutaceae bacterium]|nr:hypothetical protein [Opitutaceae bacterium]